MTPEEVISAAPRPPRRWQREAIPIALDAVRMGRTGIIYAATGSGKSDAQGATLRALAPADGWVDVIVVPTQDLVEQMREDLAPWGLGVARYYGRRKDIGRIIAVCMPSVSALAGELRMRGLRVRLAMVDECHRLGAASTTDALAELAPARRLGWSATPIRTQNVSVLRELWPDGIMYGYSIADAIADGAIVKPQVHYQRNTGTEDPNEAAWALMRAHAVYPAVVDALDVADAEWFAGWLRDRGCRAEHIDGTMSKPRRDDLLSRLQRGDIDALVHVRLLTEGVNLPWLRTLVMRAQTSSIIRYVQHMGRALRTYPGKDCGIIIDVQGLWDRFGLPAFGDDKWAEKLEEAQEGEATATGGGGGERLLGEAVIVRDLERWAAEVRAEMLAAGHIQASRVRGKGWRTELPTVKQTAILERWQDGRKSPGRYLPDEHRERFREVVSMPERLSRGGVADLLDVGFALSEMGRQHKDRTGQWWRGLERIGDG